MTSAGSTEMFSGPSPSASAGPSLPRAGARALIKPVNTSAESTLVTFRAATRSGLLIEALQGRPHRLADARVGRGLCQTFKHLPRLRRVDVLQRIDRSQLAGHLVGASVQQ